MMKTKSKNNSLKKKVLFSLLAAGMLSSFVMSAEAENYIIQGNDQGTQDNINASWVWVERFQGNDSAGLTLNGGNVAGSQFNEYPGQHGTHPDNLLSSYLIGTS